MVSNKEIEKIISSWGKMISAILDLAELELSDLQNTLKDTYKVLTQYHKEELVPKQIGKLLLEMKDYLYFAAVMEENEKGKGYYYWEEVQYIYEALEKGYFKSNYKQAYPVIEIADIVDNRYVFNLENDDINSYILAIRTNKQIPN